LLYYKTVIYIDIESSELSDLAKLHEIILESNRFDKMTVLPADKLCSTSQNTLKWFDVQSIANEITLIDSKLMIFRKNFLTSLVMKLWIACILDKECIAPHIDNSKDIGNYLPCDTTCECHRYDLSALSIINYIFLNALF